MIIDQITKFLITKNFALNQTLPIIKDFFHLTYISNTGSAFGLFKGYNLFFIFISIMVVAIIFYYVKNIRNNQKMVQIAFGLLLGGTLGNLIDRIAYG